MKPSAFRGDYTVTAFPPWEPRVRNGGTQLWVFAEDFTFISPTFGAITVPKGFHTDFASIPAAARVFIDDNSPGCLWPSAPHDYLYALKGLLPDGRVFSRAEADAVMNEAMIAVDMTLWKRLAVYSAIRSGGWVSWNRKLLP